MQVANNLSDGSRSTILLISEDGDVYPHLKRNLRTAGYGVLLAVETKDAYEWMGDGYIHADIVLIDLMGKTTDEALSMGREVRQHAKYNGHTPLVVMAEKYNKDVEGTDVNVEGNDWIYYLGEEPNQLQNLLARLLDKTSS